MAMLAKQGWRILSEPSLLVSKLLKSKYFPHTDLFNAEIGARPSYGWRGGVVTKELKVVAEARESPLRAVGVRWNASQSEHATSDESMA
ncbi:hypothetical protein QQ045_016627 [Rhodiola kirilowii]